MGDIARHRDVFLNTRDALPPDLLSRASLSSGDLTYLELGNFFTDVSQFRDPVFYLYAKQTVWREEILPGVEDSIQANLIKAGAHLASAATAALLARYLEGQQKALAALPAAGSPLLAAFNNNINDLLAGFKDVDDWIDRMLGKPIEKLDAQGKRKPEDYGFVGRFFQHFIEGITQMIFGQGVTQGGTGDWATISKLPASEVTAAFARSFTQYFPHEHTDQPPYVWDATKRPAHPMYQPAPSRVGKPPQGIMNIVYQHYIGYLAEGLSTLENAWRKIGRNDQQARRLWLLDVGKLLHGIEDWYFHSNVVELIRVHAHRPGDVASGNLPKFVVDTIIEELRGEPAANSVRLRRFFFRRLRFPVYTSPTRASTGGVASPKDSTLNLDHVYPAFPSTLDTAHTLMGALEGLEAKLRPGSGGSSGSGLSSVPWIQCLLTKFHHAGPEWSKVYRDRAAARGVALTPNGTPVIATPTDLQKARLFSVDILREFVPLVLTLLHEHERQRLVADVDPMALPLSGGLPPPAPGVKPGKGQVTQQIKRHVEALKPKVDAAGVNENNYARAARYLKECGSLNAAGQAAIVKAFEVDIESEKKKATDETPGAGGFLIKFAVKLQTQIDRAEARSVELDSKDPFAGIATDNGSDNEIIGSHSLMSKDTKESSPFFDDARVLASVASQAVLHLMLDEVTAPGPDRLDWQKILRYFIRFPLTSGGWERHAMALFESSSATPKAIPPFADLPELANLKQLRIPEAEAQSLWKGERAAVLRQKYVDLERTLTKYRYP